MLTNASRLSLVAAATAATMAIAACGSSSATSSSSRSGDHLTQAQVQQIQHDAVRFAACVRSHGVPSFPDPTAPGELKQAMHQLSGTPAYQSALSACQNLLPAGPNSQSPARSEVQIAAIVAFARCIRSHGFPRFPDPTSGGQLTHEMLASAGIEIQEPAVVRVADGCVGVTHGQITRAIVARFVAGH